MTSPSARASWIPCNDEECALVRDELERVLASAPFRNSRRYPALLRYVVEKTLSDDTKDLKERTLGIEVFHRPHDYDTNSDTIVRYTAGEVRKRLALYYSDGNNPGSIEIILPLGSYVPKYKWRDAVQSGADKISDSSTAELFQESPEEIELPGELPIDQPQLTTENRLLRSPRRPFAAGLALGLSLTLLLLLAVALVYRAQRGEPSILVFWQPVLRNPDMVLISAGRPHTEEPEAAEQPGTTIIQHILRPEARFSFTTVTAIAQVTGFLKAHHKGYAIHEAYSNTLQDLRDRPVVLVCGNDNKWTLLLGEPLRFHFEHVGPFTYIVDTQHPEKRDWSVDISKPYLEQSADYAIVARLYDATTKGPLVIIAGIGSNGTEAAGDFVVSPEALDTLARKAPHGSLDQNFEAVIKVEVIGGNTGAATIVATHFW
jgi:hypothetical protein